MTEQEAYMWLGSCPCESCSNCMVDKNLKFNIDTRTKPRHYDNGYDMLEACQESGQCKEYEDYMKEYNSLIAN